MIGSFCVILAVWDACRDRALIDVRIATKSSCSVIGPYLLHSEQYNHQCICNTYHVWLFGTVVDLPWRSDRPNPHSLIITVTPAVIVQHEEEEAIIGAFENNP